MPPGMLVQVLWEALAEAGDLARSMTALESTSASCCKVPETDYSQNRTEPMTNAIRNRNLSIDVLPAEKIKCSAIPLPNGEREKMSKLKLAL